MKVKLTDISVDHLWNCRGVITQMSVQGLADAIEQVGSLICPAVVTPQTDPEKTEPYRLIVGHRRYEAHKLIGWDEIEVHVKEGLTEKQIRIFNVQENIQRDDLRPTQEAKVIEEMEAVFEMGQKEIAEALGKSLGWVSLRVALSRMPQDIQDKVDAGLLKISDMRKLNVARRKAEKKKNWNPFRKLVDEIINNRIKKPQDKEGKKPSQEYHKKRKEDIFNEIARLKKNKVALMTLQWVAGLVSTETFHKEVK